MSADLPEGALGAGVLGDEILGAPDQPSGGATQDLTPSLFTNSSTFNAHLVGNVVEQSGDYDLIIAGGFYYIVGSSGWLALHDDRGAHGPNSPGDYGGSWYAHHVEEDGVGGYYVLWTDNSTLTVNDNWIRWTLDSAGAWASETLLSDPPTLQTVFDQEVIFEADLNADGVIGNHLQPSLVTDGDTFNAHTVTPGAVNLTPSLYSDGDTFNAHTVTPGAVALTPSLYSDDDTFYSPTVANVTPLTPSLFTNTSTFHAPHVRNVVETTGDYELSEDGDQYWIRAVGGSTYVGVTNGGTPQGPNTYPGIWHAEHVEEDGAGGYYLLWIAYGDLGGPEDVGDYSFWTLNGSGAYVTHTHTNVNSITDALTWQYEVYFEADIDGDGVIGIHLEPSLFTNTSTFHAPTAAATNPLTPSLYSDGDTFHTPTVTPGAVGLTPSLYSDDDTFYSLTVANVTNLTPSLFTNTSVFAEGVDAYTELLLHMDGSDASTTFTDESGLTQSAVGNQAQIDTAQSKFGGASGLFDGASDYVSFPGTNFAFPGDFAIEAFVRTADNSKEWQTIVEFRNDYQAPYQGNIWFGLNFGEPVYHVSSANQIDSGTQLANNTWYHVAIIRSSGTVRVFIDGVSYGGTYSDGASYSAPPTIYVGTEPAFGDLVGFNGHIDELRISIGTDRGWSGGFTPPTSAYGAVATVAAANTLTPSLFVDDDTFFTSAVTYALTPSLFVDDDTFYTHIIGTGELLLLPDLYADDDTFYQPTVTPGAVDLTPSLYSDDDTFFAAAVTTANALTPSLYADDDTFHAPTVTPGAVDLTPSLYADDDTFHTPTVTTAVELLPSLFVNTNTFTGLDGYTLMLLHMDGSDASTSFTDEIGASITVAGAAQVDTAQSKFGGASLFMADGSADWIYRSGTLPNLGTGDFVVECWFRASTVAPEWQILVEGREGSYDRPAYCLGLNYDELIIYISAGLRISGGSISTDTWYHAAHVRKGGVSRLFLDGAQVGSEWVDATDYVSGLNRPIIGGGWNGTEFGLAGWIDEVRISKGTDRGWFEGFTVPSSAYAADRAASVTSTYGLTPSLFADDDTFYSQTVTPGAVDLTPSLYSDDDTFYTPSAAATVDLTPSLYVDDDTFYSETVTPGAVDLTPSLYVDDDTFYSPTVAQQQLLEPSLFADDDTFYSQTVTAGAVDLQPPLLTNTSVFYSLYIRADHEMRLVSVVAEDRIVFTTADSRVVLSPGASRIAYVVEEDRTAEVPAVGDVGDVISDERIAYAIEEDREVSAA